MDIILEIILRVLIITFIIYIGIIIFVMYNNYKYSNKKLPYPWEVPEPDESEFDEA